MALWYTKLYDHGLSFILSQQMKLRYAGIYVKDYINNCICIRSWQTLKRFSPFNDQLDNAQWLDSCTSDPVPEGPHGAFNWPNLPIAEAFAWALHKVSGPFYPSSSK